MSTPANGDTSVLPCAKKQKTNETVTTGATPSAPAAVINPALLSSRTKLRTQFDTSQPYTHLVLRDLFDADFLRQVHRQGVACCAYTTAPPIPCTLPIHTHHGTHQIREEIIVNLQATYKETDLFKVFQTGDLANIDTTDKEHASKLPNLLALRAALYSDEFRTFVRDITGCGELSDKTDCSCNTYAKVRVVGNVMQHTVNVGRHMIDHATLSKTSPTTHSHTPGGTPTVS